MYKFSLYPHKAQFWLKTCTLFLIKLSFFSTIFNNTLHACKDEDTSFNISQLTVQVCVYTSSWTQNFIVYTWISLSFHTHLSSFPTTTKHSPIFSRISFTRDFSHSNHSLCSARFHFHFPSFQIVITSSFASLTREFMYILGNFSSSGISSNQ